ncbi:hypothetical protein WMF45_48215 [Sorangium sp. So ce448]|uniref:hypothetical protein n=1 Tax=Sorangium sp. So ce448 TaxID=3133314 RepID=UPI003F617E83
MMATDREMEHETLVHRSDDGVWAWCGRLSGDVEVYATAPSRWIDDVSCPACIAASARNAPGPRRTYHVKDSDCATRCGRAIVPDMALADAAWSRGVQCEGCAAPPRAVQLGLSFGG